MLPLFPLFLTALGLGLFHALEADHIVAVVALTSETHNLRRAILLASIWGCGHSLTLIIVGFFILITRLAIPPFVALLLELAAGFALVALGVDTVRKAFRRIASADLNADITLHTHRSFLMGIAQGMSGSGALVLLVLSTFSSLLSGLVYIILFGVGMIVGMALISILLSTPFQLTGRADRLNRLLRFSAGTLGVFVGLGLIYNIGLAQGLFGFSG
jgi:hypothetical protein